MAEPFHDYSLFKSVLFIGQITVIIAVLRTRSVFKHEDLQMFGLKLNKYEYFSPT